MTSSPRSTKDNFKQSRFSTQTHFPTALSPNHALVTVAQEVAERLQQAYPPPSDDNNSVEAVVIPAVDSDLRRMILAESLTDRELEVLQLIVDGDNSIAIARKLNISVNAAKTHIHNIGGGGGNRLLPCRFRCWLHQRRCSGCVWQIPNLSAEAQAEAEQNFYTCNQRKRYESTLRVSTGR